ncbi:MAG: 3-deoxy-D-manno-octulosonic acid kinase [Burkholderiaceae bacterium]|nr:3-deoxy-D-manno-octulosonic acid kinase [Burkholderiaceae bacterium]MDP4969424.1 3-deoxy-D-manno-octulosonic acid kinase [Burkholderiaceae bacterium]MDP5111446.1 3-deoxy-D-manno-octulosonic acid kinase [Burkholderiaceae bacterium]
MTVESKSSERWFRVDQTLSDHCADEARIWASFDPLTSWLNAQPVTQGGRAAAWFVRADPFDAVLRHYQRGGLVAKFIQNRYLWAGFAKTRSSQEFELMRTLWRLGLPVPRPLGAAAWRHGLSYRAALLTQRIPRAKPLAQCSDLETWRRAGAAIAEMHRFGVWHADLNVYNVLFDDQAKVWLIDFDRGRLMAFLTPGQRARNLSRLLRSLKKLSLSQHQPCWLALLDGYQERWCAPEQLK